MVSFSCCIKATRKPESWSPGPVNSWNPHPKRGAKPQEVFASIGETQEKKRQGSSNYRVWKRKRRVIRNWGAVVCLSGSFLSTPSFTLPPPSVLVRPCPPGGWRGKHLAFWQMKLGCWSLAWTSISLLLMVESGLQKSNSSKRLEFCVCECMCVCMYVPEDWGFCGNVEIQRHSPRGVTRLARKKANLKSSWAFRRVKREGFGEARGCPKHSLTHPIYNTLSWRLQYHLQ